MVETGLREFVDLVAASRERLVAWEAGSGVPADFVAQLAGTGVLGAMVPQEAGGSEWSVASYVEACRTLAAEAPSAQTLLTAHGMVCQILARWASPELRVHLPAMASGKELAAFALTDESAGSDPRALGCRADRDSKGWCLTGSKRWVCFGTMASLFLVFAQSDQGDVAFLVHRSDPGVWVENEVASRGLTTAHLARLQLDDVRLTNDRMVARPGFAVAQVAVRALRLGRLCVAAGSLGLAQAALHDLLDHTAHRRQFGARLNELGAVRSMISQAALAIDAAEFSVVAAARAFDAGHPEVERLVMSAKLVATFAGTTAARVCAQAHGARGLIANSAVDRRLQDARAFEIIEGSTELLVDAHAAEVIAAWRQRRIRDRLPGGA